MLQDEAGVLQLPKQLHEMYLATRNLFDPLCFANLCKSHLCWWIDLSKWFCSDKAMDVCATFHQRSSQRRCVSPGQISMQKRAIVARCCKMFQDVSRNRKVLGVLMSMPETSRDILGCYSLLWPRSGGRKAEGLQADLLYAWCAAWEYANDRSEGRVWVCNMSSKYVQHICSTYYST